MKKWQKILAAVSGAALLSGAFFSAGYYFGMQRGGEETRLPVATKSPPAAYVLNSNTKRFHLPSCESVEIMSQKYKIEITASREDVMDRGYLPCKSCNP